MFHSFGKNLSAFTDVATPYWKASLRLLSCGPCSNAPKPTVDLFTDADIEATSAIFASIVANAAHPPRLSISDNRYSLNHTSPLISLGCCTELWYKISVWFLTPNIIVLTKP